MCSHTGNFQRMWNMLYEAENEKSEHSKCFCFAHVANRYDKPKTSRVTGFRGSKGQFTLIAPLKPSCPDVETLSDFSGASLICIFFSVMDYIGSQSCQCHFVNSEVVDARSRLNSFHADWRNVRLNHSLWVFFFLLLCFLLLNKALEA